MLLGSKKSNNECGRGHLLNSYGMFRAQAILEYCLKCNQVAKDVYITASMYILVHFSAGILVHTCNK